MSSFLTVVGFTVKNKLRTKAFLITTLVIALILSVGANLPYIIQKFSNDEPNKIGYLAGSEPDITGPLQAHFDQMEEPSLVMVPIEADNEAVMRKALEEGDIDGYILLTANEAAGFPDIVYKSDSLLEMSVSGQLASVLQAQKIEGVLGELNLTAEQQQMLNTPVSITTVNITAGAGVGGGDEGKTKEQQGLAIGVVYVLIIMLFMAVIITGQLIATEITAEKSSRVMEILVTTVAPLKQMFGKIIGMLVVGLTQIAIYVAVFLININLPHNQKMLEGFNINLADIDPMLIVYAVLFYLMGYFLFATLFAAVGSIVSRTEDLGQAVMPITFLSLAGFYIGMFSIATPDAALVKITSFIPFFTPYSMFLRIGLGSPALWEIWLSIALLAVAILFFGWLSAKIYRTGVLMYGKRPSLKELRKAMKAYKV